MKIVGVGCAPGMLTEEAVRVLRGARKVYGSRRAIEIARGALPRSCEVHEIISFEKQKEVQRALMAAVDAMHK